MYTCAGLIIVILLGTDLAVSLHLREMTLRNTEANLANLSLALAEQADRAVQGIVLPLVFKFLVTDKSLAWRYDYHIDWSDSAPAAEAA